MSAKLRDLALPEELRAVILAGAQASTTQESCWQKLVWLAAAAAGFGDPVLH